jgi:aerobic-type carbon monoxide dehydrogenase small subunit (CoxS/CutS family)
MTRTIELTVNGVLRRLPMADDALLLDVLRRDFGRTGVREGCGVGACGSCTVLVDGRSVSSCLVRAVRCEGAQVTTADGLPDDDPVVAAFVEARAMQCGYCIPGFVLMVHELLAEHPHPTPAQIEDHLAGNLCRCGTYAEICTAVESCGNWRSAR